MRTWSVRGTAFALCTRSSSLSISTRTSIAGSLASPVVGSVLQQPGVDFRDRGLVEREVAVGGGDPRLGARDPPGEPAAVAGWDEPVLLAVAEEPRHCDRAEVEAPRRDERQVVGEPAVHPADPG